jgi:hypothetical protein
MLTKRDNEKILLALALAKSPAPLDYIALHTGIEDPLNLLKQMEDRGLVRQTPPSRWSCCGDPLFELTPATKKKWLTYIVAHSSENPSYS